MRILVLAPWFRTLAQVHARGLQARGHQVLVVTTRGHFEPGYGFAAELLVPAGLRERWASPWRAARARVDTFAPDVVLLDETWDLRFVVLAGHRPVITLVHDVRPHDEAHLAPTWQRAARALARRRAARVACFSAAAARDVGVRDATPVSILPLTSEMPDDWYQSGAGTKRDFLALGRLSRYKNLGMVFRAWDEHVASANYRGDHLVVRGAGALEARLPAQSRWESGPFGFRDQAQSLPGFKGSIVAYRAGSQSGVQLLSMQCGTVPVATDVGGLPEYQPGVRACIGADDVAALVRAFGELADSGRAAWEGELARVAYLERFSQERVAEAVEALCRQVAR